MKMIKKDDVFCICDFETTGITDEDYPIEIGCIFTDNYFRVLETYTSYISVPIQDKAWPEKYQNAYNVHKIPLSTIYCKGKNTQSISKDINNIRKKYGQRMTIVSDNPYFEMLHMKKVFKGYSSINKRTIPFESIFHHVPWGVNMLLAPMNVQYATHNSHRALADASNMHCAIVRAMEKINYYENYKRNTNG